MPSAQVTITQLPAAGPITGTESVPIVQNGQTVQTTTGAIAASPSQNQTFVTVNQEPTLPNSRALAGGTGVTVTDNGAQSSLEVSLTGAAASLDSSTDGLQSKSGATMVGRTITGSTGVSVTNGNGVGGNPTIGLNGTVGALAGLAGTGVLGIVSGNSVTAMQILGTTNEIDVANGTGPGNPTIGIADNPQIPGNGAMTVPTGTQGQRPGGSGGEVRYNTTSNRLEGYQGGTWSNLGTGDGSVTNVTGTPDEIDVINGTTTPQVSLADNPIVPGTGAIKIPAGATGDRPAGVNGKLRYNTTTNKFEGYQNSAWTAIGNGDGTVTLVSGTANQITVASGSTTPVVSLASNPTLPGTGSVMLPSGTTAERINPATNGMLRYNSQTGTFEGYANNAWGAIVAGGSGVTSVNVSGGTTGLTTSGGPITTSGTITLAGTLITPNGGTGLSSYTAGDMVYYAAGDALSKLAIGSNTYLLTSSGTAPQWSDPTGITVGNATNATNATSATTATNLAGGAAGSIPYQSGSGTTTFLATGTGLLANNGGNPTYTITPSGLTSVTVTQNPTSALQLATKQYVDDAVSSGITIHAPVRVETPTALNATYAAGGTAVTVTDITGSKTLTFATSPSLSINDQIVFSVTSNGIVSGTAYYVYSVPAANQVTLSLSYNGPELTTLTNGTGLTITGTVNAGVGATLTNAGANAAIQIDGISLSATNRVLVYNQANAAHNGVYTVTTVGDGSTPWVLTRATNENTYKPDSITGLGQGDYFFVQEGLTGAGESYVLTTANPIIIGTTNLTFTQFSASQVYSAGTGLTLAGTTFSITNTGVSAASYGTASAVPTIAVNAQGQITSAVDTPIAIAASAITSGTLGVARGGTGSGATPTNGQILIGNGTGYTLATLTAGTGVSITNGAGSVTINSSGGASIDDVIALAIALG